MLLELCYFDTFSACEVPDCIFALFSILNLIDADVPICVAAAAYDTQLRT